MRIVISEFLTLDGVMQAPGGSEEDRSEGFEHGGWQLDNDYFDDVGGQVVTEAFESSDGMLLGRRTYDIFAGYWPTSTEEPIAGQMNAMKKYVASTTLKESLEWENSTLLHGDVVEAEQKVREVPVAEFPQGQPSGRRNVSRPRGAVSRGVADVRWLAVCRADPKGGGSTCRSSWTSTRA